MSAQGTAEGIKRGAESGCVAVPTSEQCGWHQGGTLLHSGRGSKQCRPGKWSALLHPPKSMHTVRTSNGILPGLEADSQEGNECLNCSRTGFCREAGTGAKKGR